MRIGIFAAEEQEIGIIQERYPGTAYTKAGMTFYESPVGEHTLISVCGGIGKVHAALCTQILISEYKVTMIINTGSAGSLAQNLSIFDLVVSTDAVQHDVEATVFGYEKGQIPGTQSPFWKADKALRAYALQAFNTIKQTFAEDLKKTNTMIAGRIASGDTFITDSVRKQQLIDTFHADCVEMEGAAVAQVCVLNRIPFVIIRCISDNAGQPAALSYQQFSQKASHISALLVLKIVELLTSGSLIEAV
ncbi:MAG: 5'-methylthioadenosine/adenosylhomocysteine nucleosidase [Treponema sp.]